ncbi:MAG: hypothetical protein JWQ71_4190 [Pedosphaera sp.]|nr:hypothetical protein [Pedosphaera sp.]
MSFITQVKGSTPWGKNLIPYFHPKRQDLDSYRFIT